MCLTLTLRRQKQSLHVPHRHELNHSDASVEKKEELDFMMESEGETSRKLMSNADEHICQICNENVGITVNGEPFVACDFCSFSVCRPCYEYERKDGNQSCPQWKTRYKRHKVSSVFVASTLLENGGVPPSATPENLLKEAIHVISCGYEDKTEWGTESWGPLFGKLFFAFWVIVHLYPFLKGLMGRQNRTPTIIVVWSVLLASIFSLLWIRVDPFTSRVTGPDVLECGMNC